MGVLLRILKRCESLFAIRRSQASKAENEEVSDGYFGQASMTGQKLQIEINPAMGEVPTFFCVYCGVDHPDDFKSEEHIIPKALKNKNYVLRPVCKRLNNYMANCFEKIVLQFEPIKEALLMTDPPSTPVFRSTTEVSGKNISRWMMPSGLPELSELPSYNETNQIEVPVKTESGTVMYTLTLPFSIKSGLTSIARLAGDRHRHTRKGSELIAEFLLKLSANPGLDKDFEAFLLRTGGIYEYKGVKVSETSAEKPPIVFDPEFKEQIEFDREPLYKLFLKIAWTHAAKQIGPEYLRGPVSTWALSYLTNGHVDDKRLVASYPDLFTKLIKIEGEYFAFWKHGLDKTAELLEEIGEGEDRHKLQSYYDNRRKQFQLAAQQISYDDVSEINDELRSKWNEYRFHSIALENIERPEGIFTACKILLFGGFFDVWVIIENYPLLKSYPAPVRIDF